MTERREELWSPGESHTWTLHSRKPIGCILFKLPLYEGEDLGMFLTWWRHTIHIHFLPGKNFTIAYFRGKMNYQYYQIMMLMGAFQILLCLSMDSWAQARTRPYPGSRPRCCKDLQGVRGE
ncbi:hypothetical protein LEMLEM_LOCUS9388 [Lemmus lemmus]